MDATNCEWDGVPNGDGQAVLSATNDILYDPWITLTGEQQADRDKVNNAPNKEEMFDVFEEYDRNNRYGDYRGYYYKTLGKDTVHLTRYTGEKALEFIEGVQDNKPFCLSLSFSAPHAHDGAEEHVAVRNGLHRVDRCKSRNHHGDFRLRPFTDNTAMRG